MRFSVALHCALLLLATSATTAAAQEWSGRVRGSWLADDATGQGVTLVDAAGSACEIVVSPDEHAAVHQAARFLAADIEKIAGARPTIVAQRRDGRPSIVLSTAPADDTSDAKWPWNFARGDWEAYQVRTVDDAVHLLGSNFRGTAFAAYTLSERLGIDPLYHWTGYQPAHRRPLILKPTDFSSGPPTFRYRGMFHDDEDILPRPFEATGYPDRIGSVPTEWYERYFETALRLRMNMVAPYTRTTRLHDVQKLASDWGLFYTSHHYDILLSNPFGIDRFGLGRQRGLDGPWDWINNRDGMLRFWRGGVEENRDLNCIWPVGMRGVDDHAYRFPPGTSDAEQARVFKEVVAEQVGMTKQLLPRGSEPIFHWTLYTEMLPKYQAGTLDVPEDVVIVWPDDNDGVMRGLPTARDKWKHGVYYHLAYLGKQVKQNSHLVHPPRVAEQFRKITDAGATEYMLVNVSELREFVMEARMIAEICWDAKTALAGDEPARRYVDWWCREYFDAAAPKAAEAYALYYKAFDQYGKQWVGSEAVHAELSRLSAAMKATGTAPAVPPDQSLLQRSGELQDVLDAAEAASHGMTRREKQFFFEQLELPVRFDLHPIRSATALNTEGDLWDRCANALHWLEILELHILRAERPPFEDWYRETWIRRGPKAYNLHRPYRELRNFIATDGRSFEIPDTGRFAATRPAATTSAPAAR